MIAYMVGKLAPNSLYLTRGLVKYVVSARGYFRTVPSQIGDKIVTPPSPPQSLNVSDVNQVYRAIVGLTESEEHAGWPSSLLPWLDDGEKSILFILGFVLNGCGFLPGIAKCAFPAIWESMMRRLAIKSFFGEIVSRDCDGYTKINTYETV